MLSELVRSIALTKHLAGVATALCLLFTPHIAQASLMLDTPILGGSLLVAGDGHVSVGFLGSNAGYFNSLYLDSPSDWGTDEIFNKYSPVDGSLVDLGEFVAGTELVFRLDVQDTLLSFLRAMVPATRTV